MTDQSLWELGQISFNKQFEVFEQQADVFGGVGREAYVQAHIHRKLHTRVITLSDAEVLQLGKRSFNEQFQLLGEVPTQQVGAELSTGPPGAAFAGGGVGLEIFGGLSRDSFMQTRVHRRLHGLAASLTNQQLLELGQMSFNQQFTVTKEQNGQLGRVVCGPLRMKLASCVNRHFGGVDFWRESARTWLFSSSNGIRCVDL